MHTFVALLRGINVGGRSLIPMSELRSLFAGMDLDEVSTYIQSGNVVFSSTSDDRQKLAADIEKRIAAAFEVSPTVLLRTPAELAEIAAGNPFLSRQSDLSKLHVVFLSAPPSTDAVGQLDPARSPPDEFDVRGREIYLHLPNGAGRSKLTIDYFEKRLGVRGTARNWKTLTKLIELTSGV